MDGDPHTQYRNLRDGRPIQERLARQLHQKAGVPEGPCGYEELEKFQTFLGPKATKSSWLITYLVPVFFKAM